MIFRQIVLGKAEPGERQRAGHAAGDVRVLAAGLDLLDLVPVRRTTMFSTPTLLARFGEWVVAMTWMRPTGPCVSSRGGHLRLFAQVVEEHGLELGMEVRFRLFDEEERQLGVASVAGVPG